MNTDVLCRAYNPKLKRKQRRPRTPVPGEEVEEEKNNDKIDLFGDNPDWEPGWVRAYRVNVAGQVHYSILYLPVIILSWSFPLDWKPCSLLPLQHCLLVHCSLSLLHRVITINNNIPFTHFITFPGSIYIARKNNGYFVCFIFCNLFLLLPFLPTSSLSK